VLCAANKDDIDRVTEVLRISARVGDITPCRTDKALRTELQQRAPWNMPDFVVLVVSHRELPPCLLRYPDLRVLVLTSYRKVGSLTTWLQQGASDVASLARPKQMQHALARTIDDSAMERRVGLLASELLRSEARYSSLVKNSTQALSFWRDNELLCCSAAFTDITGLSDGASTNDWLQSLEENSRAQFGQCLAEFPNNCRVVVKEHGKTVRISRETLCEASDDNEHLISVKLVLQTTTQPAPQKTALPRPAPASPPKLTVVPASPGAKNRNTGEIGAALDIPARQTVVNNFQHRLQRAAKNSRYVAMTVDLSQSSLVDETLDHSEPVFLDLAPFVGKNTAKPAKTDRTLHDLAIYRAADRLSQALRSNTLLGRLKDDRLLIIHELETDEAPRMLAKVIQRSLGSLGGLHPPKD